MSQPCEDDDERLNFLKEVRNMNLLRKEDVEDHGFSDAQPV